MNVRWLGAIALFLALGLAEPARAEVSLVPASDGQIGAFLVAGPLPKGRARELAETGQKPSAGSSTPRFRLVHVRDGAIDLDRVLGTGNKGGSSALVGGTVELEQDLDGWLLGSIDGAARLYVDGKLAWDKPVASLRGSAWDPVPLKLARGKHELLLALEHPGPWWAFEARLVDARDLLAPSGARWLLAGTSDADAESLARGLSTLGLDAGAEATGFRPRLSIEHRRGAPSAAVELSASLRAGTLGAELPLGQLPVGPRGAGPFEALLPALDANAGTLKLEVRIGKRIEKLSLELPPELPGLLARAEQAKSALGAKGSRYLDARTLVATLDAAAGAAKRGSRRRLEALLRDLDDGHDPLARPGVVELWRRSPVDDEPEPTLLHIPSRFTPKADERYPLVVVLHGLNGTPQSILDAFLDTKSRAPSVEGFVLAPHAHGNAFYRGPGELEVLAAIDWALATYPIDPARVSLSGVSMGGTGTGHLALRYADRFSAAAPLCGYHSYFVRRDTKGRPIRPWEREQMHHWSPASFAERGRNLPLWVAHGTKDFPLENSRVLVDRYKELGYAMTDEWPDTGHDVWTKAYAGARLFPWLSRAKLDPSPAKLTVKTDALRFGKLHWAAITELAVPGKAGTLDVDASGTPVRVKTDSVLAFELSRGTRLPKTGGVELEVDGSRLSFAEGEAVVANQRGGAWSKGAPPARGKRAGLEGPMRDAYLTPLVLSYGSGDPRTTRANREVAFALARRHGPEVAYRVVADTDLDPSTIGSHSIVAVGSARDHALLARVGHLLPIRVEGGAIVAGTRRFEQPGTGAAFIHPNPEAKERYLWVVTGVDPRGIWRALSLPQLLPDFAVYDDTLGPAAAEIVLGRDARVLAAGFFDLDWKLPSEIGDPESR